MKTFLQRFAAVVWGALSGFDRVVFKGRLPQLYSPQGMNCYASANHVRLLDFKAHAKEVTRQVLAASLLETPMFGTRDGASSSNVLMHISALSSMYHGSVRPLCSVSM